MEPSPLTVGREFVRQYYTLLNKSPLHLHRFYSQCSSFTHGGLELGDKVSEPVMGQHEIHQKIVQLNFRDCHAKIRQVDAHATLDAGVVVQVSGELSNNGQPMRRFMQTFVLAPQSAKKYYLHNDIFRYQDEVFSEEEPEGIDSGTTSILDESNESGVNLPVETPVAPETQSPSSSSSSSSSRVVVIIKDNGGGDIIPDETPHCNGTSKERSMHESVKEAENDEVEDCLPVEEVPVTNGPLTYAKLVISGQTSSATPSTPTIQKFVSPSTKLPPSKNPHEGGKDGSSSRPFRGGHRGGVSGGRGGGMTKDRYGPSNNRSDVVDEDRRNNGRGPPERGSNVAIPSSNIYNDAQQVFVGNLPHTVASSELQSLFSQYGRVAEIRINNKGVNVSKMLQTGVSVPNFGFVVFEDEISVQECLRCRPIFLNDTHRLNVEEKKNNKNRDDNRGSSSMNRQTGFDRESQDNLGNRVSGMSEQRGGRVMGGSHTGQRAGTRGGYGRGGPQSQMGGQQRSRFTRKS